MKAIVTTQKVEWTPHPPYQDPKLTGYLGQVFQSDDKRFKAVYWEAQGPGQLLETPSADELICILEGEIIVEQNGQSLTAGPGDIILWLADNPPILSIPGTLKAFCVVYSSEASR